MKEITLTKNKTALVDDEDFIELSNFKWAFNPSCKGFNIGYAVRYKNGKKIQMHRQIMKNPLGKEIDHIDGNGLNNQRGNLRVASHKQNTRNSPKRSTNTSGFKGVSFSSDRKRLKRWIAIITVDSKAKNLGRFFHKEEAYKAYCDAAKQLHGEFANSQ